MKRKFELDKGNAMIAGVCSGLARMTGWDVTMIRVGAVVVTLLGAFPWTLIAYGAAAFLARSKTVAIDTPPSRSSVADMQRMSDMDRRLADVETYMTNSSTKLSREIEELR